MLGGMIYKIAGDSNDVTESEQEDSSFDAHFTYAPMLNKFKEWLASIKSNLRETVKDHNLVLACYDHRRKLNKTSAAAIMYTISEYGLHQDEKFNFIKLKRAGLINLFRTTEGMF